MARAGANVVVAAKAVYSFEPHGLTNVAARGAVDPACCFLLFLYISRSRITRRMSANAIPLFCDMFIQQVKAQFHLLFDS